MFNITNFLFLDDVDSATVSAICSNPSSGRTMSVEVSGTFTGVQMNIEGRVDLQSEEWVTLAIRDAGDLSIINEITSTGIFQIDVSGIASIRVNLTNIDTGYIHVFGKVVSGKMQQIYNTGGSNVVTTYPTFTISGDLSVEEDALSIPIPYACDITDVTISVNTAPTDADLIVDINKRAYNESSFTTLYTTQANRPTIVDGTYFVSATLPDIVSINANDVISVSIDQVGSTVVGSDLMVIIACEVN